MFYRPAYKFCLFNATRFINHEPAILHFTLITPPHFAGGLSLHRQLKSRCLHADSSAPAYTHQHKKGNTSRYKKMMNLVQKKRKFAGN